MDRFVYDQMAAAQSKHWWFVGRRKIFKRVIENIPLPASASILEIGAGTGANLEMLSKFGDVVACENDDESRGYCASNGWNTIAGRLPSGISEIEGKYDLICLFDVLEHVESDGESIRELKGLLKLNGILLIACPAYQWLYGDYDRILGHYRRYNSSTLSNLLAREGYVISRIGYFNTILFPLSIFGRLVELLGVNVRSKSIKTPISLINKVLEILFSLEALIVGRVLFPFGTTVLVQAEVKRNI